MVLERSFAKVDAGEFLVRQNMEGKPALGVLAGDEGSLLAFLDIAFDRGAHRRLPVSVLVFCPRLHRRVLPGGPFQSAAATAARYR